MTVYIDILFLREFIFDALLLCTTAWIMKFKWFWWRIGLASIIGALYTIALLFPALSFMFHSSLKIIISIIMLLIAFGFRSWLNFMKVTIVFYLSSFLAGGVATGLYYLFLPNANTFWKQVLLMDNSMYTVIQTSFIYILVAFFVSAFLIVKTVSTRRKQQLISDNLVNVTILLNQTSIQCIALIDTGNQLYDPLTRTPVVIVEATLLSTIFPEIITALKINNGSTFAYTQLTDELMTIWQTKVKIIPFRSVNKDGQFIVALKPDELSFIHNGQQITTHKVLLGLDYGQLSSERQYQAILHPALIE